MNNINTREFPDNIVRISSTKPMKEYEIVVLNLMNPDKYNKFECIVLRFPYNLTKEVFFMCERLGWCGLSIPRDGIKKMEPFKAGKNKYIGGDLILDNMIEITLKKIGALCFENRQEYRQWMAPMFADKLNFRVFE